MASQTYKVALNTEKEPVYFGFYFEDPVAMLTIWARDTATNKLYYIRECRKPVKEVHINFPVTPQNLTVGFETANPFRIQTQLRGKIQAPKVDWSVGKQTPTVKRSWPIEAIKIEYTDLGWLPDGKGGTPARIFISGSKAGIMEVDEYAKTYMPQQWLAAITRHEIGHYFHDDELKADLWALYRYMEDGYNISQFEYAFVKILRKTPENLERLLAVYNETRDFEARHYQN